MCLIFVHHLSNSDPRLGVSAGDSVRGRSYLEFRVPTSDVYTESLHDAPHAVRHQGGLECDRRAAGHVVRDSGGRLGRRRSQPAKPRGGIRSQRRRPTHHAIPARPKDRGRRACSHPARTQSDPSLISLQVLGRHAAARSRASAICAGDISLASLSRVSAHCSRCSVEWVTARSIHM